MDYYSGRRYPVIGTATSEPLRKKLLHGYDLYDTGEVVMELQLSIWEESQKKPKVDLGLSELYETPLNEIKFKAQLGEHPEQDWNAIAKAVGTDNAKSGYTWEKLPYAVRCAGSSIAEQSPSDDESLSGRSKKRTKVSGEDQMVSDVDEWVLRNEIFLRSLPRNAGSPPPWKYGLVPIGHFGTIFPKAENVKKGEQTLALKVNRPALSELPGYTTLHQKRATTVYVQPTLASFQETWGKMTDNALKGLDWSNVFVAGGLVLGTLLCPPIPKDHADYPKSNHPEQWLSSDIDLYIYGLGPNEANAKISHIEKVYRSNLPKALRSSMLIVRNSQTITFYSEWPRRRIQIVLKLIGSPREVLLNFDLDICAVGYDGTEVWVLPRCARALETGFNVFTMDLINGHYLGDRKATRDQRVFKYADKGYGIRILRSYQATLETYRTKPQVDPISRGTPLRPPPLNLPEIAEKANKWTNEFIALMLKCGHGNNKDKNGTSLYLTRGARGVHVASDIPLFSHAMLEPYSQNTSEPLGRSCLTGFELFMRHVALWEAEVDGRIRIAQNVFAVEAYGNECVQTPYDDTPVYDWNENFSIKDFKRSIDEFNKKELMSAQNNSCMLHEDAQVDVGEAARTTYADSVKALLSPLQHDVVIPLVVSPDFMAFANDTINAALVDHGFEAVDALQPFAGWEPKEDDDEDEDDDDYCSSRYGDQGPEEVMVKWRLDKILNWQMLDRRIDEVREVLWAIHRANENMYADRDRRGVYMTTHISRRAIRENFPAEEMDAFVRWVGREPRHDETDINVLYNVAGLAGLWVRGHSDDEEDHDE